MRTSIVLVLIALAACSGGGGGPSAGPSAQDPVTIPVEPVVSIEVGPKQLIFSWDAIPQATYFRLLENTDGHSGFVQIGDDIPGDNLTVHRPIAVHLHDFANALYIIQACNNLGCTGSAEVNAINGALGAIGYFKASNTDSGDSFGNAVALSADGTTLVVGAPGEASAASGVNGPQNDNRLRVAGAAYVFRFDGARWSQQAYVKASNTDSDYFGGAVAVSADGNTLAVGAISEQSAATGINGDQSNVNYNRANEGAVYLFRFDGTQWYQQAYIKASSSAWYGDFGGALALSADGNTLAVGQDGEGNGAAGINGDQDHSNLPSSGAAYIFRSDGTSWWQQAYIKASNPGWGDYFGESLDLSDDGNTLAVGAYSEDSAATGINGNQADNSVHNAGAVYLFRFQGDEWSQQAYIKASNTGNNPFVTGDEFGEDVALSSDGNTLAVGAHREFSSATGVNGDQGDNSARQRGAAYVYRYDGSEWSQEAYIKPSTVTTGFGNTLALSGDGRLLAVRGITTEVFRYDDESWSMVFGIPGMPFGGLALDDDGQTLAVGHPDDRSAAEGINGDRYDDSAYQAGAVFLY